MQLIYKNQTLGQPVPTIGANGNWFIEGQDTGIKADAAKINRGTLAGGISVLDSATEPGVYNWIDRFGELGEFNGGLWNIKVEVSFYTTASSIVQIATSTYSTFVAGIVKVRAKYYANNNNGSQWSPWITLANATQTSNPNLIKNWYFQKGVTLNQREKEEWTYDDSSEGTYIIDGWKVFSAGINDNTSDRVLLRITDNGLEFGSNAAAPNKSGVFYPFENSIRDALKGRVITFSVLTHSGEFGFKTLTVPSTNLGNAGTTMETIKLELSKIRVHMYCWAGWNNGNMGLVVGNAKSKTDINFDTVRAVKLEMGDHQTLCRQDINGKWVLNDPPPDPGELLSWGQRYLRQLSSTLNLSGFMDGGADTLHFPYSEMAGMRVNPTIIYGDGETLTSVTKNNLQLYGNGVYFVMNQEITNFNASLEKLKLGMTLDAGGAAAPWTQLANHVLCTLLKTPKKIFLSAEL